MLFLPEGLLKQLVARYYHKRKSSPPGTVLRELMQEVYSQGQAVRRQPTQEGFEAWAHSHGGISTVKRDDMENENSRLFPATYWSQITEIAWRAYANRKE